MQDTHAFKSLTRGRVGRGGGLCGGEGEGGEGAGGAGGGDMGAVDEEERFAIAIVALGGRGAEGGLGVENWGEKLLGYLLEKGLGSGDGGGGFGLREAGIDGGVEGSDRGRVAQMV
jgi:hypothetical protein